jgi:hypothetical protein
MNDLWQDLNTSGMFNFEWGSKEIIDIRIAISEIMELNEEEITTWLETPNAGFNLETPFNLIINNPTTVWNALWEAAKRK